MESALREIADRVRGGGSLSQKQLDRILREHSRASADPARRLSKRRAMAFYLREREAGSPFWESLHLSAADDEALVRLLRAKPRRTASGVATVTVLTKPWPCGRDCLYCPNDVRMPKSYLADEPACQRAERCSFDPYLQVAARLSTLAAMGHNTDKVELIVLGGTWLDYPADYRLWFMCQVFRALDDLGGEALAAEAARRRRLLDQAAGKLLPSGSTAAEERTRLVDRLQREVDAGALSYTEAWERMQAVRQALMPAFGDGFSWEELSRLQKANESAQARCVGLVVETRPDTVTPESLLELRAMGATKLQVGIQSLDDAILRANGRGGTVAEVERALALMRLFGFKSHVHLMANLVDSTPEVDLAQYRTLMEDGRFMPDEVKLYPCALVESAHLTQVHAQGGWRPYGEEELTALLAACVRATPAHARISRMIRDIPSDDILTGCKKTNLRQMVEERARVEAGEDAISEMRMREVATDEVDAGSLSLQMERYATANTEEAFLQWVDGAGRLAGFLRLSLPDQRAVRAEQQRFPSFPVQEGEAMIREVHIYGRTSRIHESSEGNQHQGLGRALVERACRMAAEAGFSAVNVISAVGTRAYYRSLGFEDAGPYQRHSLQSASLMAASS